MTTSVFKGKSNSGGTVVIIPDDDYDSNDIYTGGTGNTAGDDGTSWGSDDSNVSCEWPYVKVAVGYTKFTTVPGTPGSPGQPYIPPTSSQVSANNNEGWDNSCSSSVNELLPGQKVTFEIYHDSRGFFVGLDKFGRELQWIGSYPFGVRFTQASLEVLEKNILKCRLAQSLSPGDTIEIRRHTDGSVVYLVNNEVLYKSDTYLDPQDIIHVYAIGYEADDQVLSAAIGNFTETVIYDEEIVFEQKVDGRSYGSEYMEFIQDVDIIYLPLDVVFSQQVYAVQRPEFNGICELVSSISIPVPSCTNTEGSYNILEATVSTIAAQSVNDSYIPPRLSVLESIMAPVTAQAEAITVAIAELEANVTEVRPSLAENTTYNALEAVVSLPVVDEPILQFPEGYMLLYSDTGSDDRASILKDVVIPLYIGLKAVDNVQMFKDALIRLDESVSAKDEFSIFADREIALDSICASLDNMGFTIDDLPDHSGGIAWVMNINSGATSIFLDYGFNSFIELDGKAYGVSDTGIWALQGTSAPVPASGIDYGLSNLGSPGKKRIPHFYAAVASSGKLMLRLLVDGMKAEYFALSYTDYVEPNKINIGRGFHAVYWNPILIAPEGVSIEELDTLEWKPMTFSRRI